MIIELVQSARRKTLDDHSALIAESKAGKVTALPASDKDDLLMQDYAAGNNAAFEQLYSRYRQPLYKFIRNSCGCESQSSELFQDVWLRVVKSRSSYSSTVPFKAWLFRIARNRTIDFYRQNGQAIETSLDDELSAGDVNEHRLAEPEAYVSQSERSAELQGALQKLPALQREVILLHYIAGMTLNEIANVVDAKPETVKSRLRYATRKIRTLFQEVV